jgi:hypothetical protein
MSPTSITGGVEPSSAEAGALFFALGAVDELVFALCRAADACDKPELPEGPEAGGPLLEFEPPPPPPLLPAAGVDGIGWAFSGAVGPSAGTLVLLAGELTLRNLIETLLATVAWALEAVAFVIAPLTCVFVTLLFTVG